jgi:hypothetical protein
LHRDRQDCPAMRYKPNESVSPHSQGQNPQLSPRTARKQRYFCAIPVEIDAQAPLKSLGLLGSAPAPASTGAVDGRPPEHCREREDDLDEAAARFGRAIASWGLNSRANNSACFCFGVAETPHVRNCPAEPRHPDSQPRNGFVQVLLGSRITSARPPVGSRRIRKLPQSLNAFVTPRPHFPFASAGKPLLTQPTTAASP